MAARPPIPSVEFNIKARENLSLEGAVRTIPRIVKGHIYPCQMQKTQQFSCLFRHYAKHNGLNKDDLVFYFVDELEPDGTPETVHLLPNDEILVGLRNSPQESEQKSVNSTSSSVLCSSSHSNDPFKSFLNNKELSDVTFKFVDKSGGSSEEDISAHKVVLAARCEYFKMMFTSGYSESSSNVVPVEEISRGTFLSLLQYLYSGDVDLFKRFTSFMESNERRDTTATEVDNTRSVDGPNTIDDNSAPIAIGDDKENSMDGISQVEDDAVSSRASNIEEVVKLLVCANRYLQPELQLKCEEVLFFHREEVLSLQNICHYTQMCDTYGAKRLREACRLFIIEHIDFFREDEQLRKEISDSPELALLMMDALSAPSAGSGNGKHHLGGSGSHSQMRKRQRMSGDRSNAIGFADDADGSL